MASPEVTKRLSQSYGVPNDAVRAIIGLSQPIRKTTKLYLTSYKDQLKGALLTASLKLSLSQRREREALALQQLVQDEFTLVKRVLSMLNIQNEFDKTASLQPLVKLLVSSSSTQVSKPSSFTDLEAALNTAVYTGRQAARSVNIAKNGVQSLNAQIEELSRYIGLIDEIEKL